MSQHTDTVVEATKAIPPLVVGGITLLGVGLSDWVLFLTIIYTAFQLYFLLRDKWWRQRKDRNGRK